MNQNILEIRHLSKDYGTFRLEDVSFSLPRGVIMGLIGENGAGKSTTMNILTGYLSATSGTAVIDGIDILEDPTAAKKLIGSVSQSSIAPPKISTAVVESTTLLCSVSLRNRPRQRSTSSITIKPMPPKTIIPSVTRFSQRLLQ